MTDTILVQSKRSAGLAEIKPVDRLLLQVEYRRVTEKMLTTKTVIQETILREIPQFKVSHVTDPSRELKQLERKVDETISFFI